MSIVSLVLLEFFFYNIRLEESIIKTFSAYKQEAGYILLSL